MESVCVLRIRVKETSGIFYGSRREHLTGECSYWQSSTLLKCAFCLVLQTIVLSLEVILVRLVVNPLSLMPQNLPCTVSCLEELVF